MIKSTCASVGVYCVFQRDSSSYDSLLSPDGCRGDIRNSMKWTTFLSTPSFQKIIVKMYMAGLGDSLVGKHEDAGLFPRTSV